MATSRRMSFLAVVSVGVGAVVGLGGCVCNPPAPPSADLSACLLVSDVSKEQLVRGRCYVFHAPERRGEIRTYSVYVDSELRVIARGCGGGGGGGGGGGQYGNGGGGGGGSNFGSDAVSLPVSQTIEIKVGKGGQGGSYRPTNGQCETGPDRNNDSIPVDRGCAGERGESTLILTKDFEFEFKGGEGGGSGARTSYPNPNPASTGGNAVWLGGRGGRGGVSATQANAGSVLAGGGGTRSAGEFGAPAGLGGSILTVYERGRILSGGGGGGGGFRFSIEKPGKGGDGANASHERSSGNDDKKAQAGQSFCGGGGGGAGWEVYDDRSRGGDGGDGLLILDLR